MSTAYINRSLTTVRTELEFLLESEVITPELCEKILKALPEKFSKDMPPRGVDKLDNSTDKLSKDLEDTHISAPSNPPPRAAVSKPLGFCKALYEYRPQESEDLNLDKGDKLVVIEHLSEDWWKGYKKGDSPSSAGVFPSNYVQTISESDFESRGELPPPQKEKAEYVTSNSTGSSYGPPPPQYGGHGPYQQLPPQQSYSSFPPPSTNYYQAQSYQPQPQPQPQVVPDQPQSQSHLRKFGGKLGNAAIFGAGATLGSDLVNSIF